MCHHPFRNRSSCLCKGTQGPDRAALFVFSASSCLLQELSVIASLGAVSFWRQGAVPGLLPPCRRLGKSTGLGVQGPAWGAVCDRGEATHLWLLAWLLLLALR